MSELTWPHLYRVTLRGFRDAEWTKEYIALSWRGPTKAVAMAVEAHLRSGEPKQSNGRPSPIYDADVEDLGPAPRDASGTVGQGPPGYLEDRDEF